MFVNIDARVRFARYLQVANFQAISRNSFAMLAGISGAFGVGGKALTVILIIAASVTP